jgi:SAM-dependent methyltransferase
MAADVHLAADFYGTARGAVTARLLRARLAGLWPNLGGRTVLGLGYAQPYLRLWRDQGARCVALTPAQMGATRWPAASPGLSCTAEEDALPFPDLIFDNVLLVHGLEAAENAVRLLRELWRVLKDDGKLLIVAPNRTGLWAYLESTPFGHGEPYSHGQVGRLLAGTMFRVERRDAALYLPPTNRRVVLRAGPLFERTGRRVAPALAGVIITEAVKDVYAGLPLRPAPHRRLVLADARAG